MPSRNVAGGQGGRKWRLPRREHDHGLAVVSEADATRSMVRAADAGPREITPFGLSPDTAKRVIEAGTLEVAYVEAHSDGASTDPQAADATNVDGASEGAQSSATPRGDADSAELLDAVHASLAPIVAELSAGGRDARRQTELVRTLVDLVNRLHTRTVESTAVAEVWARWLTLLDHRLDAIEHQFERRHASPLEAVSPLQVIGVVMLVLAVVGLVSVAFVLWS
jgi:hypothetical protein